MKKLILILIIIFTTTILISGCSTNFSEPPKQYAQKKEIKVSDVDDSQNFSKDSARNFTNSITQNPSGQSIIEKECFHSNMIKFTSIEESRMKEIMKSVLQGGIDMPTITIYNEFWSIMNRHGRLCEEDLALTREGIASEVECTALFYQDALQSLLKGKSYKSSQRISCESKTILALFSADEANARLRANEELMFRIANRQSITTPSGDVVFTEKMIQSTLNDLNARLERVNKLFSTTSPSFNSQKLFEQEIDQLISEDSKINNKLCEEQHGPSIYKSMPGGGSYCDCKPGYVLRPIMDGKRIVSSWCVKE